MKLKLKPCPFCGMAPRKPKIYGHTIFPFEERWAVSHFCQDISVTAYGNSEETAIEAWNRRAEPNMVEIDQFSRIGEGEKE